VADEDDGVGLEASKAAVFDLVVGSVIPGLSPSLGLGLQAVFGGTVSAIDEFFVGRDLETRAVRYQKLALAFTENVASAIEFAPEASREEAVRKVLEEASAEVVDALLRCIREAMEAVSESAIPYLAKLMADRLQSGEPGQRRFFRDACKLLCDVDLRELREVWGIAKAVEEIREQTAALSPELRPHEYKLVLEKEPGILVISGGRGEEYKALQARAEVATALGREALARSGLVRPESSADGVHYTGTGLAMEWLAMLFHAVGPPG